MQPWKFFLRKVPGLPGSGMPPKLSFDEEKTERCLQPSKTHKHVLFNMNRAAVIWHVVK